MHAARVVATLTTRCSLFRPSRAAKPGRSKRCPPRSEQHHALHTTQTAVATEQPSITVIETQTASGETSSEHATSSRHRQITSLKVVPIRACVMPPQDGWEDPILSPERPGKMTRGKRAGAVSGHMTPRQAYDKCFLAVDFRTVFERPIRTTHTTITSACRQHYCMTPQKRENRGNARYRDRGISRAEPRMRARTSSARTSTASPQFRRVGRQPGPRRCFSGPAGGNVSPHAANPWADVIVDRPFAERRGGPRFGGPVDSPLRVPYGSSKWHSYWTPTAAVRSDQESLPHSSTPSRSGCSAACALVVVVAAAPPRATPLPLLPMWSQLRFPTELGVHRGCHRLRRLDERSVEICSMT